MATAQYRMLYRNVVRELAKGSISPRANRNKVISSAFRTMFERRLREPDAHRSFEYDMDNAVTFLRSQRTYKALLERYNPLVDLTAEERIEATARRVGLNMPKTPKSEDEK
ncbi:hypothetical protein GLOTRDRAFT_55630 [Gloeophyllum trabeum ATCC 11539]|uniref:Uncharacterized protein n=1 Tax=Gloeophyllum trabeum (strain ATCC 11539 / FP-39264 / Madison 617) TaxID=670483 RepID=S7RXB5_GLOTA|nr:uncharacterized protein GLOTRDRAFT_55630 [Gloeophyllum trabeum ATCC 11539]EPQ59535.1 hypothetical protein GLOTRDRAFT_55630 [Gloeophyllum trabeum ATCC 11539]